LVSVRSAAFNLLIPDALFLAETPILSAFSEGVVFV